MQDDRPRAHERAVLDRAALHVHEVADHAVVADDGRVQQRRVDDAAVLDARPGAHGDAPVVAAQHGLGPHRGVRADVHVADHRRVGMHECLRIDLGDEVTERVDGHRPSVGIREPPAGAGRVRAVLSAGGRPAATSTPSPATATRSCRTPSSPTLLDELTADLERLERVYDDRAVAERLRGRATRCGSTTCSRSHRSGSGCRSTTTCCPIVEGVLDAGLPRVVALVDPDPAGRVAPSRSTPTTSSCRSPSRTRPPCATRCGRSPTSPRPTAPRASSPAPTSRPTLPTSRSSTTSIPAEMPRGSVLVWHGSLWHGGGANTTDDRPHRHRDELLRRLGPPAGEPTARHPGRGRPHLLAAPARAVSATASTTC